MAQIKRYKHPRIALCRECKGQGFTTYLDQMKDEVIKERCETCAGTGRVIVSGVIEVTVVPFDAKTKVYG
ncbi:MAG: hypothetical protein ACRCUJ_01665 [Phocaeicola sp.]